MDGILEPLVVNRVVNEENRPEDLEAKSQKSKKISGRGEWIRATDLLVPNSDFPRLLHTPLYIFNNIIGPNFHGTPCRAVISTRVATSVTTNFVGEAKANIPKP
jgi:hypothetical protein